MAGPNRNADGPLTEFYLSPGSLEALQVFDAVSGLGDRANSLLSIILAVTDPGQPNLAARHENFANGSQQRLLALGLQERVGALMERPQSSSQPTQRFPVGLALL